MSCIQIVRAERCSVFFFQAEDGIRDVAVTGVQTCALPISPHAIIARFEGSEETVLFDAVWDAGFREQIFRLMLDRQHATGKNGQLIGTVSPKIGRASCRERV